MEQIILGNNCYSTTDSNTTGLNNNILVIGGSGSGKTMSYVQPNLLQRHESNLIVSLSKRNLVEQYMKHFQQKGYRVYDMNFIEPNKATIGFDPLPYLNKPVDVASFAQSIVYQHGEDRMSKDPFWDESAISLLIGMIGFVKYNYSGASFAKVVNLLTDLEIKDGGYSGIETNMDNDFKRTYIRNSDFRYYYNCFQTFVKNPPKTASCIYTALNNNIDKMFTPELLNMMENTEQINFNQFIKQKSILFISTSCVNNALNSFVNIFYSFLFKNLFELAQASSNFKLPIPLHIMIDDFACSSRIHDFPKYISMIRECDISTSILVQSQSQISSMYGANDAKTIINNCDRILFMGSMDLDTASDMSLRLNIPREDVLYMPVGKMYVIQRGSVPVYTSRYPIYDDEKYQKLDNNHIR